MLWKIFCRRPAYPSDRTDNSSAHLIGMGAVGIETLFHDMAKLTKHLPGAPSIPMLPDRQCPASANAAADSCENWDLDSH
jgi:hypothetical protein